MDTPIPFEPRRFRTAAAHYLDGRPAYAIGLIVRVAAAVGLGPGDRVLDLGCGPAQLARAFAPYVAEVVGVDPEPEMLRVARDASVGIGNVTFREGSSYDLAPNFGIFRMCTMGRSFHWMDRADTLRRLDALIVPDGVVVLFSDTRPDLPDNAWYKDYRALLDRYAADDPSRARWKDPGWIRHEGMLLASAFRELEQIGVFEVRDVSKQSLIDRALSLSSNSRAKIGDERADAMVADLMAMLPDAGVREVIVSTALIARR